MKTKKINKKLVLNKKRIADLSDSLMGNVNGGDDRSVVQTNCLQCPTQINCTKGVTVCVTISPCIC